MIMMMMLLDEIRDLSDQLNEKEHNIRDLLAQVKRLESEKSDMQAAIEEADAALEQNEARIQKAIQEQSDARAEADRRLAEKEGDFDMTRLSTGCHCVDSVIALTCF